MTYCLPSVLNHISTDQSQSTQQTSTTAAPLWCGQCLLARVVCLAGDKPEGVLWVRSPCGQILWADCLPPSKEFYPSTNQHCGQGSMRVVFWKTRGVWIQGFWKKTITMQESIKKEPKQPFMLAKPNPESFKKEPKQCSLSCWPSLIQSLRVWTEHLC